MDASGEPIPFGRRVAQLRERQQLSQQELAKLAKVSYQTIWRIERGLLTRPSIQIAAHIAKALGASLDFLSGIYDEREIEELIAAGVVMAGTGSHAGRSSTGGTPNGPAGV